MAVDEDYRKKGIGSRLLKKLEEAAIERKAEQIVLNARENALVFYKKNGYCIVAKGHTLFGSIPHYVMKKELNKLNND